MMYWWLRCLSGLVVKVVGCGVSGCERIPPVQAIEESYLSSENAGAKPHTQARDEPVKRIPIPPSPQASKAAPRPDPKRFKLVERILSMSFASTWEEAKREWELDSIYFADPWNAGTCLCGHSPILEQCELFNSLTGETVTVGNHCVGRFLDLPSATLFRAIRRVAADHEHRLSIAAVEFAAKKGWLTEWEVNFCVSLQKGRKRTRPLSVKQAEIMVRINQKILRMVGHS